MKFTKFSLAALLTSAVFSAAASAGTATFTVTFQEGVNGYYGTLDTYINEDSGNSSYGGNNKLEVDGMVSTFNSDDLKGLLRFTSISGSGSVYEGTSSLNYIPTNATISAATLTIVNLDSGNSVDVQRMANTWNESSTWNTVNRGTIATDGSWDGSTGAKNFTVTSAVQAWMSNPSSNHGWLLTMGGSNGAQIASSENGTVSNRPKLSVTFSVDLLNLAPTLNSITAAQKASAGQVVNFSASATDPGNDSLTYKWDLNNDGVYGDLIGSNISWAFGRAGHYAAKVQISDGEGGVTYGNTSVHIKNKISLAGSGSPVVTLADSNVHDIADTGIGSIAVQFDGSITPDNPLVLAMWLSGDTTDWQSIKSDLAEDGLTVLLAGDNNPLWEKIAEQYSGDSFDMLVVLNGIPNGVTSNTVVYDFNLSVDVQKVAAVPEAATLSVMGLGAGVLLAGRRRR